MLAQYERPFVLAIDIGSTSTKVSLYDARARRIEGTEIRDNHPLHTTPDGGAEESPMHVVERVEGLIDAVLARVGESAHQIAAVGMDTMASNALGLDQGWEPVTPIYTYADTRARNAVEDLRMELDVRDVYQRTGTPQHTSYLPSLLRWLQNACPAKVSQVHRWMDVGTFLYSRWFGTRDVPTSYSIASWTGLLNRHRLQWDQELLDHLHVPVDMLPPLAEHSQPVQGLTETYATRWPALKDVPFFLAVGDGLAANVGSGCVSARRVALTVGTSGAVRVLLDREVPEVPPGLWAYRVGRGSNLLGGAFSDGGSVFAWAVDSLKLPPQEELDTVLSNLAPDGHGLTVLPFLSGERSPGWAASAFGTIHGITISTTPLQVLQAALEAVSYRFALVSRLLADFVEEPHEMVASGGAITSSPYWLQVMADVLQHPVVVLAENEATSRGTAALALNALGVWPELDTVRPELGGTYHPDPEQAEVYQRGIERQHQLYDRLVGHDTEVGERIARVVREGADGRG